MRMSLSRMLVDASWRHKILVVCSIFLVLSAINGVLGGYFIYIQDKLMRETIGVAQHRANAAVDAKISIIQMDRALQSLIAVADDEQIRKAAIASIRATSNLDEVLYTLTNELPDSEQVKKLQRLLTEIRPFQVKIIKAAKVNDDQPALALATNIYGKSQEITQLANSIVDKQHNSLSEKMESIKQQGKRIISMLGMIVVGSIVFGIIISIYTANLIHRPLTKVKDAMDALANGDLTIDLKSTGNDEIGKVTDTIAYTIDKLSNVVSEILQESNSITTVAEEVAHAASCINDITNDLQEKANHLDNDTKKVHETSSVSLVNLNETKGQAEKTTRATNQVVSDISHTVEQFQDFQKQLNITSEQTRELASIARDITNMSESIRDISDQTNLLALNAAIEAARAGEQGRGFAVVADEVRTLASRTSEAVDQINMFANGISTQVELTVSALDGTVESADKNIEILSKVADKSTENGLMAKDMLMTMNQVMDLMNSQEHAEEGIMNAANFLTEMVVAAKKKADILDQLSQNMKSTANDLQHSVSHFNV